MAFSIESRVPYLDHRLVEFALALPDSFLIRSGRTKAILLDAGKRYLPDAVFSRRLKLGFATPQHDWTRHVVLPRLRECLDSPALKPFVNTDATMRALDAELGNAADAPVPTLWWRLYNAAKWYDAFCL